MKKAVLIGLILLIVGVALFTAGYIGSGRDLSVLNGELGPFTVGFGGSSAGTRQREKSFDPAELQSLLLEEDNIPVRMTVSPDGEIHLRWRESEDNPLEITAEGGSLTAVRRGEEKLGLFLFSFSDPYGTTELQLPEGLEAELTVRSSNASLTAEGLSLEQKAELTTSNASVTLRKITGTELGVKTSNGSVKAEEIDCASFTVQDSNGSVTLRTVSAETVYAKTGNSSIEVRDLAARKSVELITSNGSIRGTLAGSAEDYTIESKTSNGSNNLPRSWGRGTVSLRAETSNSSINLRFLEDE